MYLNVIHCRDSLLCYQYTGTHLFFFFFFFFFKFQFLWISPNFVKPHGVYAAVVFVNEASSLFPTFPYVFLPVYFEVPYVLWGIMWRYGKLGWKVKTEAFCPPIKLCWLCCACSDKYLLLWHCYKYFIICHEIEFKKTWLYMFPVFWLLAVMFPFPSSILHEITSLQYNRPRGLYFFDD
jgi:hypothetical protein